MTCFQRVFWAFNKADVGSGITDTLATMGAAALVGQAAGVVVAS